MGDAAITVEFGDHISESLNNRVLSLAGWLEQHAFAGLRDIVVAYSSLTVYYDPVMVWKKSEPVPGHHWVRKYLEGALSAANEPSGISSSLHRIPVCYEDCFATDLNEVAASLNLTTEQVIALHGSKQYRVFMIGFLPGFPYLGELPAELFTVRKQQPSPVAAGSVAIAGKQTGIYTLESPGGWNIIGRTPQRLFMPDKNPPVDIRHGDRVEFYRIGLKEFEELSTH